MKVVILAGGLGTRLREETGVRPKPMVEIGGKPILWHIMKIYSHYGLNDFVVCLGYKEFMIKEYFSNYALHMSDVTFDMAKSQMTVHQNNAESWKVTLVETGDSTMTGGRIKRVAHHLSEGSSFCLTYGDGVADIDITKLVAFHKAHGAKATLTATRPPARFGALRLDGDRVTAFQEKPVGDGTFINGGFFVLSKTVLDYIEDDQTVWERKPLEMLAQEGELHAMRHEGFWQPMDTMQDRVYLESLWDKGKAPWKVWG